MGIAKVSSRCKKLHINASNAIIAIQVMIMATSFAHGQFVPGVDSILKSGETLLSGSYLQIGGYGYAQMQTDCNFVLYSGFGPLKQPIWASKSYIRGPSNCYLIMQEDCNLVVYDEDNNPRFASNTRNVQNSPCSLWARWYDAGSASSPVLEVLSYDGRSLWMAYRNSGN